MKEVFKCDYCNYIGTKEEVAESVAIIVNMPTNVVISFQVYCLQICIHVHIAMQQRSIKIRWFV